MKYISKNTKNRIDDFMKNALESIDSIGDKMDKERIEHKEKLTDLREQKAYYQGQRDTINWINKLMKED